MVYRNTRGEAERPGRTTVLKLCPEMSYGTSANSQGSIRLILKFLYEILICKKTQ
jgi:hypothetical protein